MSTSFVSINRKGFWMNDSILELFLRFAALHIEDSQKEHSLAHRIRDGWLLASRGFMSGASLLYLDADTATEEGRQVVLNAIESLLEALRENTGLINRNALNLMGIASGRWTTGFQADLLIEVGEAFVALVNGHPFGDAGAGGPMPGSRYPKE
jgi:hypothetical protein